MVDKKLSDFLLEVKKEHEYTVRILIDDMPSEDQLARLKANLNKYELISISQPKKTIWQKQPYGWANAMYKEALIFKVKTGLPASLFKMGEEIAKSLDTTLNLVVVHPTNQDPAQTNLEPLDLEKNPKYVAGKPIDVHTEYENYFGEQFKENFLKTILAARKKETQRITTLATNPNKK